MKNIYVFKQFEPYYHPVFGETIRSRRHYQELLKQHKMVEVGNEKTPAYYRRQEKLERLREQQHGRR